jgi:hypothetical protein
LGCALVGRLTPHFKPASPAGQAEDAAQALEDGYRDFTGALHIHTTSSHDAHGSFEDVIRTANLQALDYVIITEHNTLQPLRDGKQGWHGAVLALIGMEISTRGGHYLALNVTEEIDRHTHTTQEIIDEVARQGGLGFIAHPYFKQGRWRDWAVTGVTGIEAYNVAHDTIDENKARLALWTIFSPREPFYWSILDRPYDPLRAWDELIGRRGRSVGIGAVDAHEFHALGLKFAPYEDLFRLCRTHVLVRPEALAEGKLTPALIYDALARGHAYVSIDLVQEVRRFSWMAEDGERILGIMGDEVPLAPTLHLTARVPSPAVLTVYRDGRPIADALATEFRVPVTAPGAYRVEAARNGKPWIFSNPIYVREPEEAPASAPSQP